MKKVMILLTVALLIFLTSCGERQTYSYTDGVYNGVGEGNSGPVPVTVTVEGGKIVKIEVGPNQESHETGTTAIRIIPQRIIDEQTPFVDVVSDATETSTALINATAQALGVENTEK
ncbi:MAG: FMN-binding protein [Erysipelotrichaceae bacterium]|nr:FMN-binding protein [Erysipelotrichaceae bacterium]